MPTPDEDSIPPTPPTEPISSHNSFASCPPEEERDTHAPREARPDSPMPEPLDTLLRPAHATRQTLTPDPEPEQMGESSREGHIDGEKAEHVEDAALRAIPTPPSPISSPRESGSDNDVKLAQPLANTALSMEEARTQEEETAPMYLYYPPADKDRPSPHATTSFLRPGSKFQGSQTSDRQVYQVQVEIKDVDLTESFLCGYLRIQGLTDDHPTLTTFFEGEIIGPKHLFRTTHPSWNSNEKIDLQHWARFPAFKPLAKQAKSSKSFTLKNYLDREHLFMRWKEYFLVPDHRVKSISGASFEGFYYICFDQCKGEVSGIYFHAKSEKFQQLELKHVDDGGCMGSMEFR